MRGLAFVNTFDGERFEGGADRSFVDGDTFSDAFSRGFLEGVIAEASLEHVVFRHPRFEADSLGFRLGEEATNPEHGRSFGVAHAAMDLGPDTAAPGRIEGFGSDLDTIPAAFGDGGFKMRPW